MTKFENSSITVEDNGMSMKRWLSTYRMKSGCVQNYMQIREQSKELKQSYKKVKDNNNLSGRGRKTSEFYKQVGEIIGDRPTEVGIYSDSETEENRIQYGISNDKSDDIVNLSLVHTRVIILIALTILMRKS